MEARYYSSGNLLLIAKESYEEAKEEIESGEKYSRKAIVSIVFAVAYLEGFLNDLIEYPFESKPNSFKNLRQIWPDLERLSLSSKFQLMRMALCGEPFDKGNQPFQDFSILIKLRNEIIHLKPKKESFRIGNIGDYEPPKILTQLENKKALAPIKKDFAVSWYLRIQTPTTAKWAYDTVVNLVESFIDGLPENEFKEEFKSHLGLHIKRC